MANDLEDILKMKVDIVDLENADLYFIHQVMLNKEIVLDRDINRRVSFEVEKLDDVIFSNQEELESKVESVIKRVIEVKI